MLIAVAPIKPSLPSALILLILQEIAMSRLDTILDDEIYAHGCSVADRVRGLSSVIDKRSWAPDSALRSHRQVGDDAARAAIAHTIFDLVETITADLRALAEGEAA